MTVFVKPALNTIWADRGDTNTPSDLKIARGWVVEIPPHQQMNWWMKRVDSFLVHMNQRGIPAWDATMQYYANLSYVQNPATGVVYRCIQDSLNNNPTSSPQYWVEAFMARGNAYTKAEIDAFRTADKTYADTSFLRIADNLSDVPNKAAARANLQIYSSVESNNKFLQIANNLSELTDIQAARNTLQVYSTVEANTLFVTKTANLSDLTNKTVARANLGLGNSATLNVGQSAGTVAAGDDYRIVNAVPNGRGVYAGAGLVGGGNLTQDRWISMGTPRTITSGSTNAAYGDGTHSHALDVSAIFQTNFGQNGYVRLPNGLWFIWGVSGEITSNYEGVVNIPFHTHFPTACINAQLTIQNHYSWNLSGMDEKMIGIYSSPSRTMVQANIGYTRNSQGSSWIRYFAVGY